MGKKKKKAEEAIIIGKNIEYYRLLARLNQSQLGILAFGYSLENKNAAQTLISKFERGDQEPKATELAKISAVLKVNIKSFFDRTIILTDKSAPFTKKSAE